MTDLENQLCCDRLTRLATDRRRSILPWVSRPQDLWMTCDSLSTPRALAPVHEIAAKISVFEVVQQHRVEEQVCANRSRADIARAQRVLQSLAAPAKVTVLLVGLALADTGITAE